MKKLLLVLILAVVSVTLDLVTNASEGEKTKVTTSYYQQGVGEIRE